jgi:hypothetical protein
LSCPLSRERVCPGNYIAIGRAEVVVTIYFLACPLSLLQLPLLSFCGWLGPAGEGWADSCGVGGVSVGVVWRCVSIVLIVMGERLYLASHEDVFPRFFHGGLVQSHSFVFFWFRLVDGGCPASRFPVWGSLDEGGQGRLVAALVGDHGSSLVMSHPAKVYQSSLSRWCGSISGMKPGRTEYWMLPTLMKPLVFGICLFQKKKDIFEHIFGSDF